MLIMAGQEYFVELFYKKHAEKISFITAVIAEKF
jgi:hypothetical protein